MKIQRIISYHYQEEIKVTKEIIENEKKIASKKVLLKEKQIEVVNFPIKKDLEEKINVLNKEVSGLYRINEEKQTLFNKFVKKRTEIQKIIFQQNFEDSKNILNDYVQYYTLLLQNLHLEGKKFSDSAEIKIKDMQLNALTNQIKSKDLIIENANNEFKKKFKTDLFNSKIINNKNNYSNNDNYVNGSNNIDNNISNEKIYGKKETSSSNIVDKNLIDGLRGHVSISKSQNLLENNILNLRNGNSNSVNKANLIRNVKNDNVNKKEFKINLLGTIDDSIVKNNKSNIVNNKVNIDSNSNSKKSESIKNKPSRDFYSPNSGKAVLLVGKNKSPINKSKSPENISNVILNKKSITDKSDINVYIQLNKEMNTNSNLNKKKYKASGLKLEQYLDTDSPEE